jgi:outer membrane lipoprotein-sorting protein
VKSTLSAALALALLGSLAAPAGAEQKKPHPAKPAKPAAPAHAAKKPATAAAGKEKPAAPAKPAAAAKAKPATAAKPVDAVKAAPVAAAAAATAVGAAAAQPAHLDRAEAIRRAEESLNASPVLIADFVQIGGDGRRAEGRLFVHKVGRMRFEYAQPATMEIVSDGVSVAVRDRKLKTQDLYFISQTPLKFLLNEKIDLEKDVKLLDVVTDDSGTSITIEDKATIGGTSRIKLIFDAKNFALKQWQVSDPQGYETLVSLFNIDRSRAPDPNLFKIEQDHLFDN